MNGLAATMPIELLGEWAAFLQLENKVEQGESLELDVKQRLANRGKP